MKAVLPRHQAGGGRAVSEPTLTVVASSMLRSTFAAYDGSSFSVAVAVAVDAVCGAAAGGEGGQAASTHSTPSKLTTMGCEPKALHASCSRSCAARASTSRSPAPCSARLSGSV